MTTTTTTRHSGGLGFTGALAIAFIVLKLTHVIVWSWVWVLAPLWIPAFIVVFVCLVIALVVLLKP